ncbi:unnamed protein product [Clavelina lepadiformis]|uniref:G-protein coupled receptors family 1 profile domain-containing protein n=1 Tax=Clavelina lepadiformis TaxID=159417 RepID=A0ABP0FKC3_CLALP
MESHVALGIFFFTLSAVGFVGNGIVLIKLLRDRSQWTAPTIYFFNLALADMLNICTAPFWGHYYLNRMDWEFGLVVCKAAGAFTSVNLYASVFFLTAISIDRWIAVVHAAQVLQIKARRAPRYVCPGIWFVSFMLCLPRFCYQMINTTSFNVTSNLTDQNITVSLCTFNLPPSPCKEAIMGFLQLLKATVGFIIPMIVICLCYIRIVCYLRKHMIAKKNRKDRIARLAVLIISAFFICWFPASLMAFYDALGGWWKLIPFSKQFFNTFYPFTLCVAWTNSCVNPFAYAFTSANFTENFKCCRHSGPPTPQSRIRYSRAVGRAHMPSYHSQMDGEIKTGKLRQPAPTSGNDKVPSKFMTNRYTSCNGCLNECSAVTSHGH